VKESINHLLAGLVVAALAAGCGASRPKVSTLIKQLQHGDSAVKVRAAKTLAGLAPQAAPALPALLNMFRDSRRPVQDAAARAIGATGEEGVRAFASALSDRDSWVRCRAAEALGELGPNAAAAVPALAHALSDHDFCVSGKASGALGRVGDAAVPALLESLKDGNAAVRRLAADAIAHMGPAVQRRAAEELLPALRSVDAFERGEATLRLAAMGKAAMPVFLDLLWDKDPDLRHKAVDGLAEIGDTSPVVIDALAGLFKDPERTLQLRAAVVLGKFGQKDPSVVARLAPLLRAPDPDTRRGAIQAIGKMGTAAAGSLDTLVAIMNDEADPLREEAAEALTAMGTTLSLRAAEGYTRKAYQKQKTEEAKNPPERK